MPTADTSLSAVAVTATAATSAVGRRTAAGRVTRATAVAAAGVLCLTACVATEPIEGQGGTGTAGTADSSLTVATSYPIDDLDPLVNGYWGAEFGYAELLMRAAGQGEPTPWVLSSLEAVDDTTWRLTLNDGVTFHSGRALDGEALAQLLTWTAENNPTFAATASVASAEATGPLEVTLTTTAPSPTMPNLLADENGVVVVDVDAYEAYLTSGADPTALLDAGIYTGPYEVTALDSQAAELAPASEYWGGEPALDDLTIRFVPEVSSRIQAVQAGEVDLALYMPVSAARTLQGRDDAFFLQGEPTGLVHGLITRVGSPVMGDELVRRAFFAGIDYRSIAADVLQNEAGLATGVFPAGYPYAEATQETDLDLAGQLLDQAGWVQGADGVRTKDGELLTVRYITSPSLADSVLVAEAVQAQLREIGMDVQVVQVDDINAARDGQDWEISSSSSLLSFGGSPDLAITDLLTTGGNLDYAGISDPDLDALVAELRVTPDREAREELLGDIQELVAERGYYGVASARLLSVVVGPDLADYEVPVPNLWIDADTAPTS